MMNVILTLLIEITYSRCRCSVNLYCLCKKLCGAQHFASDVQGVLYNKTHIYGSGRQTKISHYHKRKVQAIL